MGYKANFVELNTDSLPLIGKSQEQLLDAFIFNHQFSNDVIESVWVRGQKFVEKGQHISEVDINQNFKATLKRLSAT